MIATHSASLVHHVMDIHNVGVRQRKEQSGGKKHGVVCQTESGQRGTVGKIELTEPTRRGALGTTMRSSIGAWYSTRRPNTVTQFAGLFQASSADGAVSAAAACADASWLVPSPDDAILG
jgi:carbohydrate-selective porin OprB